MKLRRIGILFLCVGILSGCKDGMALEPEKKGGEGAVLGGGFAAGAGFL